MLIEVLIFAAGLFAWTLIEYVIHGVLGHAHRTFVTPLHDVHHRDPRAVFALGAWIPTAVVLAGAIAWFGLARRGDFLWRYRCRFRACMSAPLPDSFCTAGVRYRRRGCARGIWRIMRQSPTRSSA